MELFDAIDSRASAARLTEPAPTAVQIERLLSAAGHAPDHGRLKPWRFTVLRGVVRDAFADAAARAKRARVPTLLDEQVELEREKIRRSPCIVVVGCAVKRDFAKVPEIEQVIAAGAAAQNLFLAAHALGYGVMWKTGAAAYDAGVKATVGLSPDDHIVAILHIGTRVS
ncbi:MAG TPA: nitroreductase [Steroidobacteraceae bacterium]|jgi:nitroreductase